MVESPHPFSGGNAHPIQALQLRQPLDDRHSDRELEVYGFIARGYMPVERIMGHGAADKRQVGQVLQRPQLQNLNPSVTFDDVPR
jgi:hypothetical protein